MEWQGKALTPLWDYLRDADRTVVLYGMGNGADKILRVCEEKGIPVAGFFASDGFVRGHFFHGERVMTFHEVKERFGTERLTVLLSFATSLPDVLANIMRISSEVELFAPDVPVFGNTLFDGDFLEARRGELEEARALLSDAESKRIFDLVVEYKVTGDIRPLLEARSDLNETMERLVRPRELRAVADLGAYNGDTVRQLLSYGAAPEKIYAMEPDARNFRKLSEYAEGESRTKVIPIRGAAWSREETLIFDASGNRNASAGQNRSAVLGDRPMKTAELPAMPLDSVLNGEAVDYIKYDVEGSESEALMGSCRTIEAYLPTLMVSLYHRSEDLYALPLHLKSEFPAYKGYYLRRFGGVPAWDLNLYVTKEERDV
ncbi:MAG: FkbM family methyltransferase [Ruminococcaceae bacterium]|nr:FkbM family methyltransferase [Oscillospiraceae bacterium]